MEGPEVPSAPKHPISTHFDPLRSRKRTTKSGRFIHKLCAETENPCRSDSGAITSKHLESKSRPQTYEIERLKTVEALSWHGSKYVALKPRSYVLPYPHTNGRWFPAGAIKFGIGDHGALFGSATCQVGMEVFPLWLEIAFGHLINSRRSGLDSKDHVGASNLYGPKSERVLRVLFNGEEWKVVPLAECAHVSTGTVSIVRNLLLEREWAKEGPDGLKLTQPKKLLTDWAAVWKRRRETPRTYFTLNRSDFGGLRRKPGV